MNAQDDKERSILVRSDVGLFADILQKQELRFSRIFIDRPTLIVLRHGRKTLQLGSREWSLNSGDAIAIEGGHAFDFRNWPASHGAYEAQWLVWDDSLIAEHSGYASMERPTSEATPLGHVDAEFLAAFDRAREAIDRAKRIPQAVARHRLAELLIWLSLRGVHFRKRENPDLATRVRRLIQAAPAERWTIASVAKSLALSEATLRRHLAAEGTTVGHLLVDTRMSLAMALLQSSNAPVGNIALDLGYESASRFSIRFRERFGFPPTAIRGHLRTCNVPVPDAISCDA